MANTAQLILLNGQSAAGASGSGNTQGPGDGPLFNLFVPYMAAAVQAEIFGSPAACVINIMALLNGATWDTIAVLDISEGYISGEIQPIALPAQVLQVKANLATLSGGSNPSVSCYLTARQ